MSWRETVLHVLRVPPQPAPPPGASPRVFRAARSFLALRAIHFLGLQCFAITGAIFATIFLLHIPDRFEDNIVVTIFRILEVVTWVFIVAQFIFGVAVLHLDYELRWYMVSDRAIRVREGITTVREKTITLANIQNISIQQGPLQRLLGIADVEVKTAGGGGAKAEQKSTSEPGHVAYFRGVDNADEIRTLLLEGVRRQKDAGLGDTDDDSDEDDVHAAVAELLAAARALREAT